VIPPDDLAAQPPGATPLSEEDLEGLIPTWVTTRAELNTVEAENILRARIWALQSRRRPRDPDALLHLDRLTDLHRRMFGDVWRWAGTLRRRQTNIGVPAPQIATDTHALCLDVAAQIAGQSPTAWPPAEIAARFHHRLVSIHLFPNGNGRHARLASDLLLRILGAEPLTWGAADLTNDTDTRAAYLKALREADGKGDYQPLLDFARS
jgi:Fic-DOC domain mobile mystery protein B